MSIAAILAPVFVQVGLTFVLLFMMGRTRFAAVRAGEVKIRDIALGERAWPARVTQVANTFHNQFETPVLFYALVALAIVTRQADLLFVVLSWLFVTARLVHAYVYTTTNNVLTRFRVFLAGTAVLMLMWAIFAVRILISG
ncbi:MAPEG family protein [Salinarimonas soli]|uniref:MAPEG family protein n=1 Tax=Salinarimonas soli TaxID=1638099 RepID=A0A5B2VDK3_9HYPH|nr:MAPEG family protein [Salinarimonas soli]KAA2237024.1 MAPEG family protein [Salinarimonas soli]